MFVCTYIGDAICKNPKEKNRIVGEFSSTYKYHIPKGDDNVK